MVKKVVLAQILACTLQPCRHHTDFLSSLCIYIYAVWISPFSGIQVTQVHVRKEVEKQHALLEIIKQRHIYTYYSRNLFIFYFISLPETSMLRYYFVLTCRETLLFTLLESQGLRGSLMGDSSDLAWKPGPHYIYLDQDYLYEFC